jgi:hypothetical protein
VCDYFYKSGMPVASYRKYMILFDTIGLLLFIAILSLGISMFYFNLPTNHQLKEGLFFAFSVCGIVIYLLLIIYQIKKYKKENSMYLPLQQ